MERESNQLEAGAILCRTGCGFFGSSNTDGLCSKCYKDTLKKKQQPPNSVPAPSATTTSASAVTSTVTNLPISAPAGVASPAVVATAQPTVLSLSPASSSTSLGVEACESVSETSVEDGDSSSEKESSRKKKNKCATCKKKVGLTGFTCRCGGLFCSVHRYSNEHQCTFDYRELGAEEIRRNNPVIKGEKIQKI